MSPEQFNEIWIQLIIIVTELGLIIGILLSKS